MEDRLAGLAVLEIFPGQAFSAPGIASVAIELLPFCTDISLQSNRRHLLLRNLTAEGLILFDQGQVPTEDADDADQHDDKYGDS